MQYLTLFTLREKLPALALELARQGSFSPAAPADEETRARLDQLPGQRYRDLYFSALARYEKIQTFCNGGALPDVEPRPVAEDALERLDAWLGEVWLECSAHQEKRRGLEEEQKRLQYLLSLLERFADLRLDLGLLTRTNRFIDVEIGSLPSANAGRLADALPIAGYLLQIFYRAADVTHAVVVGPSGQRAQILGLLRAAAWQHMELPPELLAPPQEARRTLTAQALAAAAEHARQRRLSEATARAHQTRLSEAGLALAHARPCAVLAGEALHGHGSLASVTGWVPRRQAAALLRGIEAALPGQTSTSLRDPFAAEQPQVPSALRHPAWLKPFLPLLCNYGVPRYGEVDPTLPFALSFVLMFGAMFGDLGQGLAIVLASLLLRRRYPADASAPSVAAP